MGIDEVMFSVDEYDQDGDVCTTGIFLHFGDTRVKVADSADGFEAVAQRIGTMVDEVREKCMDKKHNPSVERTGN